MAPVPNNWSAQQLQQFASWANQQLLNRGMGNQRVLFPEVLFGTTSGSQSLGNQRLLFPEGDLLFGATPWSQSFPHGFFELQQQANQSNLERQQRAREQWQIGR